MTTPVSRTLLLSGAVAGIVVPVVLWIDGATRHGYSLWHNGASQLGTGDRGWLQTVNFVAGGLLLAAFAVGVRQVLSPGRGATWAPLSVAVAAVGLVVAGLVPTDPALGYPPGQATGITTAGHVHQVAGLALFAGLSAAAFILAGRLGATRRAWAICSRLSASLIIVFAVAAGIAYRLDSQDLWRPAPAGLLEQLALLTGFLWTAITAARLLRTNSDRR